MKQGRILYLDMLRIVATVAVLANHCIMAGIGHYIDDATVTDMIVGYGLVDVVHFAVPIFVMITGSLLLRPERKIDYRRVLTKYVWRILVVILLIGTFFAWLELFSTDHSLSLRQVGTALVNTLQGHTWKHFWYLYMLLGLYLVVPILKCVIEKLSEPELDILIIIGLLFTSVLPAVYNNIGSKLGIQFPIPSVYVFLMLLGYRLAVMKKTYSNASLMVLISIIAIAYMGISIMRYGYGHEKLSWIGSYDSPLMVFNSCAIFLLLKNLHYSEQVFYRAGGG